MYVLYNVVKNMFHVKTDITPNGSLRRRRSRVLSEEDEGNLMDFLRTSGTDTSRERKSWGSLGKLHVILKTCMF